MSFLSRLFRRGQSITRAQAIGCIANRPMMMHASALDSMIATAQAMPERGAYHEDGDAAPQGSKPEHLISINNGVGALSISGPLFAHYGIEAWWYGGSAYDVIGAAFDQLMANPDVSQIVMMIDSPGGVVTGCFELSDKIYAARGTKPIVAITDDCAFSAAYCIASAADRIEIPRSGGLGSVGVRSQHVEISKMLEMRGYVVTTFVSGAKKADFDSTAPLSDSARTDAQAEVDRLADIFIDTVARNRGIDADSVRALQAGCLYGPSAIAAGLGDSIGSGAPSQLAPAQDAPSDGPMLAQMPQVAPTLSPADLTARDRATVADALAASGLSPDLAMALLSPAAGVTADTAADRIAHAKAVADLCVAAGLPTAAVEYATKHTSIETARAQLIAVRAEDGPELLTSPPASKPTKPPLSASAVYKERQNATENRQ